MAVVLAVGLAPLPAFGDSGVEGVAFNGDIVAAAVSHTEVTAVDADGNVVTETGDARAKADSEGNVVSEAETASTASSSGGGRASQTARLYGQVALNRATAGAGSLDRLAGHGGVGSAEGSQVALPLSAGVEALEEREAARAASLVRLDPAGGELLPGASEEVAPSSADGADWEAPASPYARGGYEFAGWAAWRDAASGREALPVAVGAAVSGWSLTALERGAAAAGGTAGLAAAAIGSLARPSGEPESSEEPESPGEDAPGASSGDASPVGASDDEAAAPPEGGLVVGALDADGRRVDLRGERVDDEGASLADRQDMELASETEVDLGAFLDGDGTLTLVAVWIPAEAGATADDGPDAAPTSSQDESAGPGEEGGSGIGGSAREGAPAGPGAKNGPGAVVSAVAAVSAALTDATDGEDAPEEVSDPDYVAPEDRPTAYERARERLGYARQDAEKATEGLALADDRAHVSQAATGGYAYRILADFGVEDPVLDAGGALLGMIGTTALVGFKDNTSMRNALASYQEAALWACVDGSLGAADLTEESQASISEVRESVDTGKTARLANEADATVDAQTADDNPFVAYGLAAAGGEGGAAGPAANHVIALVDTGVPEGAAAASVNVLNTAIEVDEGELKSTAEDDVDIVVPASGVDDNGHGTRMLEAIRAENPAASVISVKALGSDGVGTVASVYAGVSYAMQSGADVINLSFSSRAAVGNAAINALIRRAAEEGVAVVAAAGNAGEDAALYSPGNAPDAITVGACDASGSPLRTSNFGPGIDAWVEAESTSLAAARASGWLSAYGDASDWPASLTAEGSIATPGEGGAALPAEGGEPEYLAADGTAAYAIFVTSGDDAGKLIFFRSSPGAYANGQEATGVAAGSHAGLSGVVFSGVESTAPYYFDLPWRTASANVTAAEFAEEVRPADSTAYWFSNMPKLKSVDLGKLDTSAVATMEGMFSNSPALESIDLSGLSTAAATDLSSMFDGCSALSGITGPESGFGSRATDLSSMFNACSSLAAPDLSFMDVSSARDLSRMFGSCTALTAPGVGAWAPAAATDLSYLFYNCPALTAPGIGGWACPAAVTISHLFHGCSALQSFAFGEPFDTSQVRDMSYLFYGCSNLSSLDLENLRTPSATSMAYLFSGCSKITALDLSGFETSNVTDMSYMFRSVGVSSLDLSSFTTPNVTSMEGMFYSVTRVASFDLSGFDTSKVLSMMAMFYQCNAMTSVNLSGLSTPRLTNTRYMFYYCYNLTALDLSSFDTSGVLDMGYMFCNCSRMHSDQFDISSFDTSSVTDMTRMFGYCGYQNRGSSQKSAKFRALDLSHFNTSRVQSMEGMFYKAMGLEVLDISSFDTLNVTDMAHMFFYLDQLTALDVSSFDTSSVTNMQAMFCGVSSVEELDVSSFDTSEVTSMAYMFAYANYGNGENREDEPYDGDHSSQGFSQIKRIVGLGGFRTGKLTDVRMMFMCTRYIETLDMSNFDMSNVTSMTRMFGPTGNPYTTALKEVKGIDSWNTGKVTAMDAMFNACASLEELDLSKWDGSSLEVSRVMFFHCHSLKKIDMSGFDTPNFTRGFGRMFEECHALEECLVPKLDFSNASTGTDGPGCFYNDTSLKSLDLSGWFRNGNTRNVGVLGLVRGCTSLEYLNLQNFNLTDSSARSTMLQDCPNLKTLILGERCRLNDTSFNSTNDSGWMRSDGAYSGYTRSSLTTAFDANPSAMAGTWTRAEAGQLDDPAYAVLGDGVLTFIRSGEDVATGVGDTLVTSSVTGTSYIGTVFPVDERGYANAGQVPWLADGYRTSIDSVVVADTVRPASTAYWFSGCTSLSSFAPTYLNMTAVTDASSMFYNCASFTSINLPRFASSASCASFSSMFQGCSSLSSINVLDWETSGVSDFSNMFSGCTSLESLALPSSFSTAGATTMLGMFQNCSSLESLALPSAFTTADVTDMRNMFSGCTSLAALDLTNFDTGSVSRMAGMFGVLEVGEAEAGSWCASLSSVTFGSGFSFKGATGGVLTTLPSVHSWKSGSGADSVAMSALALAGEPAASLAGTWVWGDVTHAYAVFMPNGAEVSHSGGDTVAYEAGSLVFTRSEQIVANGADAAAASLTGTDGGRYDSGTVYAGFEDSAATGYGNAVDQPWYAVRGSITRVYFKDVIRPLSCSSWFNECNALKTIDFGITDRSAKQSNLDTSRCTSFHYLFRGCNSLLALDLSCFETSNVTTFRSMFEGLGNATRHIDSATGSVIEEGDLDELDISSFDSSKVTQMGYMFNGFGRVKRIVGLDDLDMSRVEDTTAMFGFNGGQVGTAIGPTLESVDLSGRNLASLTSMSTMFYLTTSLRSVSLSGVSAPCLTSIDNLCNGCASLETLDMSGFYAPLLTNRTSFIYECPSLETLDMSGADLSSLGSLTNLPYGVVKVNLSGLRAGSLTSFGNENGTYPWFSAHPKLESVDLSGAYLPKLASLSGSTGFANSTALRSVDLSGADLSSLSDCTGVFLGCGSLERVDLSGATLLALTSMAGMLSGISTLSEANLSDVSAPKLIDTSGLFSGDQSLAYVNLEGFDTSTVANMENMFEGCASLSRVSLTETFSFYGSHVGDATYSGSPLCELPDPDASSGMYSGMWVLAADASRARTAAQLAADSLSPGAVSGNWVWQLSDDVLETVATYAVLDEEAGSLTFIQSETVGIDNGAIRSVESISRETYAGTVFGVDLGGWMQASAIPWYPVRAQVKSVKFDNAIAPTNTAFWFYGMAQCADFDLSLLNTASTTNMASMFSGCSALEGLSLASFSTESATVMGGMFDGCANLSAVSFGGAFSFCGKGSSKLAELPAVPTTSAYTGKWMRRSDVSVTKTSAQLADLAASNLAGAWTWEPTASRAYAVLLSQDVGSYAAGTLLFVRSKETRLSGEVGSLYSVDGTSYSGTIYTGFEEGAFASAVETPWFANRTSVLHVRFAAKVTPESCSYWFANLPNLLDASFGDGTALLDASKTTSMDSLFADDSSLTSADLSLLEPNRALLTSLDRLFYGCTALASATMFSSAECTDSVTVMRQMFYKCPSLTTLDLSGLSTRSASDMSNMFVGSDAISNVTFGSSFSFYGLHEGEAGYSGGYLASLSEPDTTSAAAYYTGYWVKGTGASTRHTSVELAKDTRFSADAVAGSWTWEVGDVSSAVPYAVLTPNGDSTAYSLTFLLSLDLTVVPRQAGATVRSITRRSFTGTVFAGNDETDGFAVTTWASADSAPWHGVADKVTSVTFANQVAPVSTAYWFAGMSGLTSLNLTGLDASGVASMRSMFEGCSGISSLDLSMVRAAPVNLDSMFAGCTDLASLDVSGLDTKTNAISMGAMFGAGDSLCSKLASVTFGERFSFYGRGSTQLAILPTPSGAGYSQSWMLEDATKSATPALLAASSATAGYLVASGAQTGTWVWQHEASSAPAYAVVLSQDAESGQFAAGTLVFIRSFQDKSSSALVAQSIVDVTSAVYTGYVFSGIENLTATGSTSACPWYSLRTTVTGVGFAASIAPQTMAYWFSGMTGMTSMSLPAAGEGAYGLDASRVTSMYRTFYNSTSLASVSIGSLNAASLTTMNEAFSYCQALGSVDLSCVKTNGSNLKSLASLFSNCAELSGATFGGDFDTSGVTDMSNLFGSCTSKLVAADLTGLSSAAASGAAATNLSNLFSNCRSLKSVKFPSAFVTDSVENMSGMFADCEQLTAPGVDSFSTGGAVDLGSVFQNCASLAALDLSGWNLGAATSTRQMFAGCASLTSLAMPQAGSASTLANTYRMFSGCSSLASLDLSSLNTTGATSMNGMFEGCSSLVSVKLGTGFSFKGSGSTTLCELPEPQAVPGYAYSGEWELSGTQDAAQSAAALAASYDGSSPGTYVAALGKFAVTYYANYEGADPESVTQSFGQASDATVAAGTLLTRGGYSWSSWTNQGRTKEYAAASQLDADDFTLAEGTYVLSLFAQWTADTYVDGLTIDPAGGSWSGTVSGATFTNVSSAVKATVTTDQMVEIADPTRDYYTFTGWKLSTGSKGAIAGDATDSGGYRSAAYTCGALTSSGDTLRATWKAIDYTVEYYTKDKSSPANQQTGVVLNLDRSAWPIEAVSGEGAQDPATYDYSTDFMGWTTDPDADVDALADGGTPLLADGFTMNATIRSVLGDQGGTLRLYAVYGHEVTLWVNSGGSTSYSAGLQYHLCGSSSRVTVPAEARAGGTLPGQHGWAFVGWTNEKEDADAFDPACVLGASSSAYSYSDNLGPALYGLYQRTVTFKYDGNGNSGGTAPGEDPHVQYYNAYETTGGSVQSAVAATLPGPGSLARVDMAFVGWGTASSSAVVDALESGGTFDGTGSSTASAQEYKLYAVWQTTYDVRFYNTDDSAAVLVVQQRIDRDYKIPGNDELGVACPAAFAGGSFAGWASSATSASASYQTGGTVAKKTARQTVSLYAVWVRDATFSAAGSTGNADSTTSSQYFNTGTYKLAIPAAARTSASSLLPTDANGWAFSGWSTSRESAATVAGKDAASTTNSSRAYFAVYTRSVQMKFDPGEEDGESSDKIEGSIWTSDDFKSSQTYVTSGAVPTSTFTVIDNTPSTSDFSYAGHTFAGWGDSAGDATVKYARGTGAYAFNNLTQAAVKTVYALWIQGVYTITLDVTAKDAGDSSAPLITNTPSPAVYEQYSQGFFLDAMAAASSKMSTSANKVTVPERRYTVKWDLSGGNIGGATGRADEILAHTFNGFYTDASAGTQYIVESGFLASGAENTWTQEDASLYARWTLNAVSLPTPTRTGYTFEGWNIYAGTDTSASPLVTKTKNTTYIPKQHVTVVAQWAANKYTVRYWNGTGDSAKKYDGSSQSDYTFTYGTARALRTYGSGGGGLGFSAEGAWSFVGWSRSPTGLSVDYQDGATVSATQALTPEANAVVDLYAVWQRTVNFKQGLDPANLTSTPYGQNMNPCTNERTFDEVTTPEIYISETGWDAVLGWRADVSPANSAPYAQKASVVVSDDALDYYAVYSRTVTFLYMTDENTTASDTSTQYYNAYGNSTVAPHELGSATIGHATGTGDWRPTGWSYSPAAGAAALAHTSAEAIVTGPSSVPQKTFHAVYSRDATFYRKTAEGATGNTVASQYLNAGGSAGEGKGTYSVITPGIEGFERVGGTANDAWVALGWRDDTDAGAAEFGTSASASEIDAREAGDVFYAVYSSKAYFKTSSSDGATTSAAEVIQYLNSTTGNTGNYAVKAPGIGNIAPAKNGDEETGAWTILGWRADQEASGKEYDATADISVRSGGAPESSDTFYAVYSRTARFYSGADGAEKESTQFYSASGSYSTSVPVTLSALENWDSAEGWRADDVSGEATCGDATAATLTASADRYRAVYKRALTLKYDGNTADGGSTGATTQIQYYNSAGKAVSPAGVTAAANGFTKVGYRFDSSKAWGSSASGGTQYAPGAGVVPYALSDPSTKTVYALWVENPYTVRFKLNGGSISEGAGAGGSDYVASTATAFTVSAPKLSGHTFAGWHVTGMDANRHEIGKAGSAQAETTASSYFYVASPDDATQFKGLVWSTATAASTVTQGSVQLEAVWVRTEASWETDGKKVVNGSKVYDGEAPAIASLVSGDAGGMLAPAKASLSYALNGSDSTAAKAKDAGSHVVAAAWAIGRDSSPTASTTNGGTVVTRAQDSSCAAYVVDRAALRVSADDKSKVYGQLDPQLTATAEGYVGEEDAKSAGIEYALSRASGEDVKEDGYTIEVSGDTEQGNYSVTFVAGTMTVGKAPLSAGSLLLDGQAGGKLVLTYDGKVREPAPTMSYDLAAAGTSEPALGTDFTVAYLGADGKAAASPVDAGRYTVTATGGVEGSNYSAEGGPVSAAFAIAARPAGAQDVVVSLAAAGASFTYDGAAHAAGAASAASRLNAADDAYLVVEYAATGLGEDGYGEIPEASWAKDPPSLGEAGGERVAVRARDARPAVPASGYESSDKGAYQNFTGYVYATETLTIKPRLVEISTSEANSSTKVNTKVYGENDPSYTTVVTDKYNSSTSGDTVDCSLGTDAFQKLAVTDNTKINFNVTRAEGETAGEYQFTISESNNPNYTVTSNTTNKFSITKRSIKITPQDRSYTYNGDQQGPTGAEQEGTYKDTDVSYTANATGQGLANNSNIGTVDSITSVTLGGTATNVTGSSPATLKVVHDNNSAGVVIKNSSGSNVTSSYNITYGEAKTTITPFDLSKSNSSDAYATLMPGETVFYYNGAKQAPEVAVTANLNKLAASSSSLSGLAQPGSNAASLVATTNYTVSYVDSSKSNAETEKPTEAGTYYVKITGTGNYTGEVYQDFQIYARVLFDVAYSDPTGQGVTSSGTKYTAYGPLNSTLIAGPQSGDTSELNAKSDNAKGWPANPERTGFDFGDWHTTEADANGLTPSGGTSPAITESFKTSRSTQTVYAHWKPHSYTVTYHAGDKTATQSFDYATKTTIQVLSTDAMKGILEAKTTLENDTGGSYELVGWNTSVTSSGSVGETTGYAPTGDLVNLHGSSDLFDDSTNGVNLYAVWKRAATINTLSDSNVRVETKTYYQYAYNSNDNTFAWCLTLPALADITSSTGGDNANFTPIGWKVNSTDAAEADSGYSDASQKTYVWNQSSKPPVPVFMAVYKRDAAFYSGTASTLHSGVTQYHNAGSNSVDSTYSMTAPTATAINGETNFTDFAFDHWTTGNKADGPASGDYSAANAVIDTQTNRYYAVYKRDAKFHSSATTTDATNSPQYFNTQDAWTAIVPKSYTGINTWTPLGWTTSDSDVSGTDNAYKPLSTDSKRQTFTGSKSDIQRDFYAVFSRELTVGYQPGSTDAGNQGQGTMAGASSATQVYNAAGKFNDPEFTLLACEYKLDGFAFKGWISARNDKPVYTVDGAKPKASELGFATKSGDGYVFATNGMQKVDVTAKWGANQYKVSFALNSGDFTDAQKNSSSYFTSNSEQLVTDVEYTVPAPTLNGYTFAGWYVSKMDDRSSSSDNNKIHTIDSASNSTTTATAYFMKTTGEMKFKNLYYVTGSATQTDAVVLEAVWMKNIVDPNNLVYAGQSQHLTPTTELSGGSAAFTSDSYTAKYTGATTTDKSFSASGVPGSVAPHDAGEYKMVATWTIKNDVARNTDGESISTHEGLFKISPLAITITAATAEKVYDGEALTRDNNNGTSGVSDWSVTTGQIVSDDTINVAMTTGSTITHVGKRSNIVATVEDATNNVGSGKISVTTGSAKTVGNYSVTTVDGELTITPRPIMVELNMAKTGTTTAVESGGTFDYDGNTVTTTITTALYDTDTRKKSTATDATGIVSTDYQHSTDPAYANNTVRVSLSGTDASGDVGSHAITGTLLDVSNDYAVYKVDDTAALTVNDENPPTCATASYTVNARSLDVKDSEQKNEIELVKAPSDLALLHDNGTYIQRDLVAGSDYEVAFYVYSESGSNNTAGASLGSTFPTSAGTYTAEVKGKGSYTGTRYFPNIEVGSQDISGYTLSISNVSYTVDSSTKTGEVASGDSGFSTDFVGYELTPSVTLKNGSDPITTTGFALGVFEEGSSTAMTDWPMMPGTYTVRLYASGSEYSGYAETTLTINKVDISKVTFNAGTVIWRSNMVPSPVVKAKIGDYSLTAGVDYSVTWKPDLATVAKLDPKEASADDFSQAGIATEGYTKDGGKGEYYYYVGAEYESLASTNSVLVASGKLAASGNARLKVEAPEYDMDKNSNTEFTDDNGSTYSGWTNNNRDLFPYTGSAIEPKISVNFNGTTKGSYENGKPISQGSDYLISYSNNKNPGARGRVILVGIGNFSGKKNVMFTIGLATASTQSFALSSEGGSDSAASASGSKAGSGAGSSASSSSSASRGSLATAAAAVKAKSVSASASKAAGSGSAIAADGGLAAGAGSGSAAGAGGSNLVAISASALEASAADSVAGSGSGSSDAADSAVDSGASASDGVAASGSTSLVARVRQAALAVLRSALENSCVTESVKGYISDVTAGKPVVVSLQSAVSEALGKAASEALDGAKLSEVLAG